MEEGNLQPAIVSRPIILCVDDEKIILDSLKVQLSNYFDHECQIELAESGEEGLEIIQELLDLGDGFPHVIISDQIMPRMKGDEFLFKANQLCPDSLRILLTGQADKNDIINAINKAGLYRYIAKPWDNMDLNLTVKEAILAYCQTKEIEIQRDQLLVLNNTLEKKVKDRTQQLEVEKAKSDELLLNILPEEVITEIKEKGSAQPKHYDLATIAFIDIVGFTIHSRNLPPEMMIHELNVIFQAIDEVVYKYDLEKIKTLGDGYMLAGGIPTANTTNPVDVVKACLEIQERMKKIALKNAVDPMKPNWRVRIGVNSGELVAGVIGTNKFAYDVWGTTVNIASRVESAGMAERLNISQYTYELVKDHFDCEPRGKVQMKNMGEIDMYFVKGPRD